MDLSDPTRSVTSTLDGAVLAALASAGAPLTVGQVAQHAVRGSEIGVRRSLARLVEQGIVRATLMGRNQVHELNRDHVAAGIAVALADLRTELWRRMRDAIVDWKVRPVVATVFGSAARRDGDTSSDIDVLLVHPPFPGEPKGAGRNLGDAVGEWFLESPDKNAHEMWQIQLDRFRGLVERWTGNPAQIVDLAFHERRRPSKQIRPLLAEVERDGIELHRAKGTRVWPSRSDTTDG